MLRGVNKRGPVAARVLHVLTTQRASPTRRAVTNDALQESRREPPENSVSLTGGPRAPPGSECDSPPEPWRPLRHLSRVGPLVLPSASAGHVGLFCICLELRPRRSPAGRCFMLIRVSDSPRRNYRRAVHRQNLQRSPVRASRRFPSAVLQV